MIGSRKKVFAVMLAGMLVFFGTGLVYSSTFKSETRVLYSLDARKNNEEIIRLIDDARSVIYFAVYYFSRQDIAEALIRAKNRGVKVQGIVDRDGIKQASNAQIYKLLTSAGINVATQRHEDGIMHIKVLVTEKAYASGSYNWTVAATEANDEVLEIGTDKQIHDRYFDIIKSVIEKNSSTNESKTVKKIGIEEAKNHIGEYMQVEGSLYKISKSPKGTTFLQFCPKVKCPFSAVVFASDQKKFPNLEEYKGNVTISGIIRSYNGSSEIILNETNQLLKN